MKRVLNPLLFCLILLGLLSANSTFVYTWDSEFGQDITHHYHDVVEGPLEEKFIEELKDLQQYKIILIPGFLSENLIKLKDWIPWANPKWGEYFDDQMRLFKKHNISHFRLVPETENDSSLNAQTILNEPEIMKSDRPLIFITHSKGGNDLLEAMLKSKELRQKTAGWIPIQAPFFGTPVASKLSSGVWNGLSNFILEQILQGSHGVMKTLSENYRFNYMLENHQEINKLNKQISIISFTSTQEDNPNRFDTLFETVRFLFMKDIRSDGLVPTDSQFLPHSDYIFLNDVDHVMPVKDIPLLDLTFDRSSFTKGLLILLLNKIQKRP